MANEHTTPVATPAESPKNRQALEVIAILFIALIGFAIMSLGSVKKAEHEFAERVLIHQSEQIAKLQSEVSVINEQKKLLGDKLSVNIKNTEYLSDELRDLEKKVLVLTITQKVKP